jgi:hypothetical protein
MAIVTPAEPTSPDSDAANDAVGQPTRKRELRARAALQAKGQVPTQAAVATYMTHRRQAAEALAAHRQGADEVARRDGLRAGEWVREYRAQHGFGPLWGELGKAMGWQRRRLNDIIRACQRAGHLTFEQGVGRSLDVPRSTSE